MTDAACEGLSGMELGDKKLIVQRASIGSIRNSSNFQPVLTNASAANGINPIDIIASAVEAPASPTPVLLLLNMVTPEELLNDDDYEDIMLDVRDECEKFGDVVGLAIPRPRGEAEIAGVGKVIYSNGFV